MATCPGGPMAAATASAASRPTVPGASDDRYHPETLLAAASMSEANGASYCRW